MHDVWHRVDTQSIELNKGVNGFCLMFVLSPLLPSMDILLIFPLGNFLSSDPHSIPWL